MQQLLRAFLIPLLLPFGVDAQGVATYSDVHTVEESGDVVGTEITLRLHNGSASGTIRHFEGIEPEPIKVAGRLNGNNVTLSGTSSHGTVEVKAQLTNGRLRGKLLHHLEGQTNEVSLDLPRTTRERRNKD